MIQQEGYDKKIFAKNLNHYMTITGTKPADICRLLNVSKSTVSSWCNAQKVPRMDKIEALANYFNVLKSDLIENTLIDDSIYKISNILPLPKTKKVPRLGVIACGKPILAEENIEGYDEIPEEVNADFTLVCKGDSMINARIMDGDTVYIRSQPDVENGEIAAVLLGDEATLKRVRKTDTQLILWPENPCYSPMVFKGETINTVKILGKAIVFQSHIR